MAQILKFPKNQKLEKVGKSSSLYDLLMSPTPLFEETKSSDEVRNAIGQTIQTWIDSVIETFGNE
jgi:hypothetical protein